MKHSYEVTLSQYEMNTDGTTKTANTMGCGLFVHRDDALHVMMKTAKSLAKQWKVAAVDMDTSRPAHVTFEAVNSRGVKYSFHLAVVCRDVYDNVDEAVRKTRK